MPTPERAIVLHDLQLGQRPLPKELRDLLDTVQSGPPAELIVAGGVLGAGEAGGLATEGLAALARAARAGLTLLPGEGDEALADVAAQARLREQLGRVELSFGDELRPGMRGRALQAPDGIVWVMTAAGLDPARGRELGELLGWPQLRSFLRAFARQLEMKRTMAPPSDPQQLAAQVLARAVFEVAPGKEEKALAEVLRHLDGREPGRWDEGADELAQGVLQRAAQLLREQLLTRVRYEVDDAAAVVVVGARAAHEGDEDAPTVVLTGAAAGPRPTWVEVTLGTALRVQLRGLRPLLPPLKPPPPQEVPAQPATPAHEMPAQPSAPAQEMPAQPSAGTPAPEARPPEAPAAPEPAPAQQDPAAQVPAGPPAEQPAQTMAPADTQAVAPAEQPAQSSAPAAAKEPAAHGGESKGKKKKGR